MPSLKIISQTLLNFSFIKQHELLAVITVPTQLLKNDENELKPKGSSLKLISTEFNQIMIKLNSLICISMRDLSMIRRLKKLPY